MSRSNAALFLRYIEPCKENLSFVSLHKLIYNV